MDGFTFEVWAPSYFHVTKDKRNLSIPFLLKAQRLSSESVLNVTPNAYMCKVLEALKYKKHSYGSNVLFSIFSFESSSISWAKMPQDHSCIGIDSRFTGRNDLLWIVNSASEIEQLLCSSDIIESYFGKFKNKMNRNSRDGLTEFIFTIATFGKPFSKEEAKKALESIRSQDLFLNKRKPIVNAKS